MESYKELKVWQKAMILVKEIYSVVKLLPREEQFALSEQMRRSAVSIPSNIAEGFGRNSKNDYVRFLNITKSSSYELETQLYICVMLKYVSKEQTQTALALTDEIGKMLSTLAKTIVPND